MLVRMKQVYASWGVQTIGSPRTLNEVLMMTARGKLQRIRAAEISVIGRNTQGVRIMSLDEGDTLTAVVRVPQEENSEEELAAEPSSGSPTPPEQAPQDSTSEEDTTEES